MTIIKPMLLIFLLVPAYLFSQCTYSTTLLNGQSFTIPPDIYSIQVTVKGARGGMGGDGDSGGFPVSNPGGMGGPGGMGASIQMELAVNPGDLLFVHVGSFGNNGASGNGSGGQGGGGGGGTALINNTTMELLVVAGAGGGGQGGQEGSGGGPGTDGEDGENSIIVDSNNGLTLGTGGFGNQAGGGGGFGISSAGGNGSGGIGGGFFDISILGIGGTSGGSGSGGNGAGGGGEGASLTTSNGGRGGGGGGFNGGNGFGNSGKSMYNNIRALSTAISSSSLNGGVIICWDDPSTPIDSQLHLEDGDAYFESSNRGMILKSPNGNCWRITIGDDGELKKKYIPCP